MRHVTRKSMWETNSSSTHSIVITPQKEGKTLDDLCVENGVCSIFPGEFGWGIEEYDDAQTKASYCFTWAKEYGNNTHLEMLCSVIKKQTGADKVEFIPMSTDKYYKWGYIDHQSNHVCGDVFESDDKLRDFIFSHFSILRIDNDNH